MDKSRFCPWRLREGLDQGDRETGGVDGICSLWNFDIAQGKKCGKDEKKNVEKAYGKTGKEMAEKAGALSEGRAPDQGDGP